MSQRKDQKANSDEQELEHDSKGPKIELPPSSDSSDENDSVVSSESENEKETKATNKRLVKKGNLSLLPGKSLISGSKNSLLSAYNSKSNVSNFLNSVAQNSSLLSSGLDKSLEALKIVSEANQKNNALNMNTLSSLVQSQSLGKLQIGDSNKLLNKSIGSELDSVTVSGSKVPRPFFIGNEAVKQWGNYMCTQESTKQKIVDGHYSSLKQMSAENTSLQTTAIEADESKWNKTLDNIHTQQMAEIGSAYDTGMEITKNSGALINGVFDAFKQDLETQERATEQHFKTVQTELRYKTGLKLAKMWHENQKESENLHVNKEMKLREMQYNCLLALQGSNADPEVVKEFMQMIKQNGEHAKPAGENSGFIHPLQPPEYVAMLTGNNEKLFEIETGRDVDAGTGAEDEKEEK